MSFYRDAVRTARKDHKCDLCGGVIKVGEKYHDKAGHEDDFWQSKECEKCQSVIDEYVDSDYYDSSEGYCDEWLSEWWRDVKCYECKHRYPACEPNGDCDCSDSEDCDVIDKHGRCTGDDTCDEMTHYCRCEKFEPVSISEPKGCGFWPRKPLNNMQ